MSVRRLTLFGVLVAAAACTAPHMPGPIAADLPSSVRVLAAGKVVDIPLEDYVVVAALSEVSPVNETPETIARVFDVQTVVARTYAAAHVGRHKARGFDLCDTTHCQLYQPARLRTSRFAAAAKEAGRRTAAIVLRRAGRPADAPFHSDCGGHTAASADVWGTSAAPYLQARVDDVPDVTHRTWRVDVETERLRTILNADADTRVGRRLGSIRVVTRDESGRAASIEIAGQSTRLVRGETLRTVINRALGDRAVMSTRLTVTARGGTFTLAGTGFGHGVGLCQAGTLARARRGDPMRAILGAYYGDLALNR